VVLRGDYAAGYRATRRILALGEARGYEPGTSAARMVFAVFSCWAEPIENSVLAAQRAREGLIAGGVLANAGYSYYASAPGMLDCAPSLDRNLTGDWGLRSSVGVPVNVEGRLWGAMVVAFTHPELLPENTETRLAGFTELVATAIANAGARAEVTAARARVVAAADQARQRIERDLHDGAQQRLVTLALQLRAAQATVPPELGELGAEFGRAAAGATGALDELREIARGIHPAILADGGLRPALTALARRSPVPVDLQVRADGRLPEPVEISAYFIVAEALTNAAKYARASAVGVEAEVVGDRLRVTVRDDGIGGADLAGGTGLAGLKDRVEALGGRIVLHSPRGGGTSLCAEFPLTAPSEEA
jgi:signal transduction histidine kinase